MYEKRSWSRVGGDDLEAGFGGAAADYDTVVRNGFIRKVFGVLTLQLLLTAGIATPFVASDKLQDYVSSNNWVVILTMVLSFGFLIGMTCVPGAVHSYPANYILLVAFTACEGVLIGVVSARYTKDVVLLAGTITIAITIALTIFALQTKWDFTILGGALVAVLVALVLASIMMIFIRNRIVNIVFCAIGAVLFSVYLIYDVQLIAGGHKHELGVDDYIPAALNVYLDIINLFLFILRLIGDSR